MLKHFQDNLARDISAIGNPYVRYGAWGGYWLFHGVGFVIFWGSKLTLEIMKFAAAIAGSALVTPPKKKKKGH